LFGCQVQQPVDVSMVVFGASKEKAGSASIV
jgi:hypothetical protein